eukprot:1159491-Pelagomonas_calceolata.AAC.2
MMWPAQANTLIRVVPMLGSCKAGHLTGTGNECSLCVLYSCLHSKGRCNWQFGVRPLAPPFWIQTPHHIDRRAVDLRPTMPDSKAFCCLEGTKKRSINTSPPIPPILPAQREVDVGSASRDAKHLDPSTPLARQLLCSAVVRTLEDRAHIAGNECHLI